MIVGEAHIIVRAITTGVKPEIRKAFNDASGDAEDAGTNLGKKFSKGFSGGMGNNNPAVGFLNGLAAQASAARGMFDALIVSSYTLGPAIAQLVGGISALVGALGALVGMAAGALPAIGALAGAMGGLLNTVITLKFAFAGVSSAIQAGLKAKKAEAAAVKGQTKDLTNYVRRIKDAQRTLNRVLRDNARTLAEAADKIREAQNNLAEKEQSNAQDIVEAKREVENAQLKLNDAYEKGYEQIQQLNFDAEDAALAEKRAALELDKARETLLRVQDLPPNSRARKEAELAYAQADLNYRKAIDANGDAGKAADKANKAGVEGTSDVVSAKEALYETELALGKAVQRQQKDHLDGINAINEAYMDQTRARYDAAEREADARRNLHRAEVDYEKAKKAGAAKAVAAVNAYANALADLGPAQRKFVKFMVDVFIPAVKDLKIAAGSEFFPKLIPAMSTIQDKMFPMLEKRLADTGSTLGDLAIDIANRLTSPKALGQINRLWDGNDGAIVHYGNVAGNMLESLLTLLIALKPLVRRFNEWMDESSEKINKFFNPTGNKKGEKYEERLQSIKDFFKKAGDIAAAFGEIFGNLFGGINNIILGLMEPGSGGWQLLHFFKTITQQFQDWTGSAKGKNEIAGYFKDVAHNAIAIVKATGPLLGIIGGMGKSPAIAEFARTLSDPKFVSAVKNIADKFLVAGPALAAFVVSATEFLDVTLSSDAIQQFWDVLTNISDALVSLFSNPIIQQGFVMFAGATATLVAFRTAWKLLRMPLLAVMDPILSAWKGMKKLKEAGDAAKKAAETANAITLAKRAETPVPFAMPTDALKKVPMGGAIGGIAPMLSGLAAAAGPILLVVAAVAALAAVFYLMWQKSEKLREGVKALIDHVIKKATDLFEGFKKKLDEALKPIGGINGALKLAGDLFKTLGDAIATYVLPWLTQVFDIIFKIWEFVGGFLIDTLGDWIQGIKDIFDADNFFDGLLQALLFLPKQIFHIFENIISGILDLFGINSPSKVFADIGTNIVKGLINALLFLPKKFLEVFVNAMKGVTDWWEKTGKKFFTELPGKVLGYVKTLWDFWWKGADIAWKKVSTWWTNTVIPFFMNLPKEALRLGGKVWEFIQTKWDELWRGLQNLVGGKDSPIGKILGTMKSIIENAGKTLWNGLKSGFQAVGNWIIDRINDIAHAVNKISDPINKGLGLLTLGKASIPHINDLKHISFAAGGIVSPRPGGLLAQIGEAGRAERVEPLDPDGLSKRDKAMIQLLSGGAAGGATFNIYAAPGMDVNELAKAVNRELAFQMRRGAA